jgi:O-antigen/teichoic acid export membrane protein
LPILFGAQWQNAVPVMMAVSLVCLAHALTRATPHVLISLGKPEVYAKLNFIQLIFTLIGFMIAVKFGIVAAGFAFALVSLLMIPFHLVALRQIAGFPPAMIIARCLPIVGAGAIMVAAVLLAGTVTVGAGFVLNLWFVTLTVSADLLTLVFQIAIGAIVYPIALYALAGSQVRELLATVAESLPPSLRFLAPTKA